MSKVYCAEGNYNEEFTIPWTNIGQTSKSIGSRLNTKPFGRKYRTWIDVDDPDRKAIRAKRIAVEALAHFLAAKKFGSAPRTYVSRDPAWNKAYPKGVPYPGYTETFKCELEDAEELIKAALGYVEIAWEVESK